MLLCSSLTASEFLWGLSSATCILRASLGKVTIFVYTRKQNNLTIINFPYCCTSSFSSYFNFVFPRMLMQIYILSVQKRKVCDKNISVSSLIFINNVWYYVIYNLRSSKPEALKKPSIGMHFVPSPLQIPHLS